MALCTVFRACDLAVVRVGSLSGPCSCHAVTLGRPRMFHSKILSGSLTVFPPGLSGFCHWLEDLNATPGAGTSSELTLVLALSPVTEVNCVLGRKGKKCMWKKNQEKICRGTFQKHAAAQTACTLMDISRCVCRCECVCVSHARTAPGSDHVAVVTVSAIAATHHSVSPDPQVCHHL